MLVTIPSRHRRYNIIGVGSWSAQLNTEKQLTHPAIYKGIGMPRDYKKEYEVAKKNKTKSYMHKFTEEGKKNRNNNNKARRALGLAPGDPREASHKVPQSKGGSNKKSNLVAKSRSANRKQGNKRKSK